MPEIHGMDPSAGSVAPAGTDTMAAMAHMKSFNARIFIRSIVSGGPPCPQVTRGNRNVTFATRPERARRRSRKALEETDEPRRLREPEPIRDGGDTAIGMKEQAAGLEVAAAAD